MSGRPRRSPRDRRRRTHGQNFLADGAAERVVDALDLEPGERVLEPGAGRGALTIPMAERGACVVAVEADPVWAGRLRDRSRRAGPGSVVVRRGDVLTTRLPHPPFRVAGNPPFGITTALLARLLDHPERGPDRVDLVVQREVASKLATSPPVSLRASAWAPWWTFDIGVTIARRNFRPVPAVDAALLTIRRRIDPVLPLWLAPRMRDLLRSGWHPPPRSRP